MNKIGLVTVSPRRQPYRRIRYCIDFRCRRIGDL